MVQYISTRGKAPRLNFADTALAGLATDGGLYVPVSCPVISQEEFADMASWHYIDVAMRVMLPFVQGSLTADELRLILKKAYASFTHEDIAPLRQLNDQHHVLELFHGPTLAFKDVALQFLGHLFDHILSQRNDRVTIVGATSGDTGSAAIDAFKGKANADIFILHPKGRVSEVQRRQMTTVLDKNVHNIAVDGSFDDCQDLVKALFNDVNFRTDMKLSAVNSINFARILAQIVYYIYAGTRITAKTGKAPVFCVPTGNFGNVYAGYVAQAMGLPIERLVVATNKNDILYRFFATGRMQMDGVKPSLSPSMDIQVSSNFERVLFDIFEQQGGAVEQTMKHFREKGPFHIEEDALKELRKLFASGRQDDAETTATIKRVFETYNYTLDPHTAVGMGVAEQYGAKYKDSAIVTLATAHPAKFPDAVKAATGVTPELPLHLADLYTRDERYDTLPNDLETLKSYVRQKI